MELKDTQISTLLSLTRVLNTPRLGGGNGVVSKVVGLVVVYFFLELEHGMSLCEAILLYTALKAKLGALSEEEPKLFRHGHCGVGGHARRRASIVTNSSRSRTRSHKCRAKVGCNL